MWKRSGDRTLIPIVEFTRKNCPRLAAPPPLSLSLSLPRAVTRENKLNVISPRENLCPFAAVRSDR